MSITPVTYPTQDERFIRPSEDHRYTLGFVAKVFREHMAVIAARIARAEELGDDHEKAVANIERLDTLSLANRLGLNVGGEK